ncbi:MAG: DUF1385 domain-containing protein [Clostridiales bacterium]|nr:DUF1385 domain-containing protein [Clostridiales bacterium]MBR6483405.1 DUF1385 domain-containing protein [Clostridiales bacterium]
MSDIKKTTIGGQALIEGIMMVGPRRTSIAVRKGDGTIHVEEIKQSERVTFFEKVPFVRGCIRFWKMLVTGTGALMKSAELSEEGAPDVVDETKKEKKKSALDDYLEKHYDLMVIFSAILGILISIGIFILLPNLIVSIASKFMSDELRDASWMSVVLNIVEGILRMLFFFIYLRLSSKIEGIERVWRYHGAEHKTIACYEAGEQLTTANIRKYSRFHPRCGTAFMFIVLAISILIYTIAGAIIGSDSILVNALLRLILIPIICGVSFEILRFVGKHDKNPVCRGLSKPGLWLQKFTTGEPDDAIIEVAIAAMQAVIPENAQDDVW